MNFKDSGDEAAGNIGPLDDLPPSYVRDSTKGKFTGLVDAKISSSDRELLRLDPLEMDRKLTERLLKSLSNDGTVGRRGDGGDGDDDNDEDSLATMERMGRRIQEEEIAFNTLGRKSSDIEDSIGGLRDDRDEDGDGEYSDPSGFTAPLIQVEQLKQSLDEEKKSRKNDGTLDGAGETMELVNVKTSTTKKKKDTTMTATGMDKSGIEVATTYDGKTQMVS